MQGFELKENKYKLGKYSFKWKVIYGFEFCTGKFMPWKSREQKVAVKSPESKDHIIAHATY